MSTVWIINLFFQPIIHYSLVIYHRMFINKLKGPLAHPKINKNGFTINRWWKGKLFLIRGVGQGSQRLVYSIEMGGEILRKMASMYPTYSFTIVFILCIFQVSNSSTISRFIKARQLGIRISLLGTSFVLKIFHTMLGKRQKLTLAIFK